MIKRLKEQMLQLGLKPKKELIILLSVDVFLIAVSVIIFVLFKQLLYVAIGVGLLFIFDLLFLTRYSKRIMAENSENLQEFATIFGYFRIFIHNGYSVYSALKEVSNFASENLKKSLEKLVEDIDKDKSVQPFVDFARQFNEIIIEEMMISIYQLIDDGETSEYLNQFELIFDKFSDLLYQKYLRAKDSRLGLLSSAPLIGSCFLIIVLTLGIITIIGDLINGI